MSLPLPEVDSFGFGKVVLRFVRIYDGDPSKGFVPASSPSAMAAYEKMVRELEAAEEQSAEKSGPR